MLETTLSILVLVLTFLSTLLGLGAPPITDRLSNAAKASILFLIAALLSGIGQVYCSYKNGQIDDSRVALALKQRDEASAKLDELRIENELQSTQLSIAVSAAKSQREAMAIDRLVHLGATVDWYDSVIINETLTWRSAEVQSRSSPTSVNLTSVKPVNLPAALAELKHLPKLHTLTAKFLNYEQQYESLGELVGLRTISIADSHAKADWTKHLQNLDSLNELHLASNNWPDTTWSFISDMKNLRKVSLYNISHSKHLAQELGKCMQLEQLYIDRSEISDRDLHHIENIPNLRKLILTNTEIGDGVLRELSDAPKLKWIMAIGKVTDDVDTDHGYPPSLERFDYANPFTSTREGVLAVQKRLMGVDVPMPDKFFKNEDR